MSSYDPSDSLTSRNGGPRSVVAGTCADATKRVPPMLGSAPPGGPHSVVAADATERIPPMRTRQSASLQRLAPPTDPEQDRLLPARKTPAHHPIREISNRSPIVFLTVCAQDRRPLFVKPDIHELMKSAWGDANTWHVGRYVLMPDHIHLFCAPNGLAAPSLARWVQFWKAAVSRHWPRPEEQPVWQKSFWDTQLRRGEGYGEKWEYVRRNPVRASLCADSAEWPFQGEMNILMWHD